MNDLSSYHGKTNTSNYTASIIDAISDYYRFLTRLPHINPDNLAFPPKPHGWQTINETELKARGRPDEAIEFLRHLPYLRNSELPPRSQNNITNDSLSIAYCDGEVEHSWLHAQQPTPGHVIWLANADTKEGHYLLLDIIAGTITVWNPIYPGPPLPDSLGFDAVEALDPVDQWMNYATLPVGDFFDKCRRAYEKLVWIPVPELRNGNSKGTARHYERISSRENQDYYLYSDEEYEDDCSSSSSASQNTTDDGNDSISNEEVDQLMKDAAPDVESSRTIDLLNQPSDSPSRKDNDSTVSPEEGEYETDVAFEDVPADMKQMWQNAKVRHYTQPYVFETAANFCANRIPITSTRTTVGQQLTTIEKSAHCSCKIGLKRIEEEHEMVSRAVS